MEPVELDTGSVLLRPLSADPPFDDRQALVEAFTDPVHQAFVRGYLVDTLGAAKDYVIQRRLQWDRGERASWAVAERSSGALLGEVGLKKLDLGVDTSEIAIWVHPAARGRGIATTAVAAAVEYGFGTLGLRAIDYVHGATNLASGRVARHCRFTFVGPIPDSDDVLWRRTA